MRKLKILGRTVPAAVLALAILSGGALALISFYAIITGTASVTQSVTINAVESTWKFDLKPIEYGVQKYVWDIDKPIQLGNFEMRGGDEQDVQFVLTNWAEVQAPVLITKTVTGPDDEVCEADLVSMWHSKWFKEELCFKDAWHNVWTCYEDMSDEQKANADTMLTLFTYDVAPDGEVYYTKYGSFLLIHVKLWNLKPGKGYQLTLQGRTGDYSSDVFDDLFAHCGSPGPGYTLAWECGDLGDGGFWNFEMNAVAKDDGTYEYTYILGLPEGFYDAGVGFLVKEEDDPSAYEKYGSEYGYQAKTYKPILMEKTGMNWEINQKCFTPEAVNSEYVESLVASPSLGGTTCKWTSEIVNLPARPFVKDPTVASEELFCVRNALHLAAWPGVYDFSIKIEPVIQ